MQMWKTHSYARRAAKHYEVWMSGTRSLPSSVRKFSGFIEKEFERRRNGVWFYNHGVPTYITGQALHAASSGRRLISDFLTILPSSVRSFSTWLRAKLIPVVSVSFILSVGVLAILISAASVLVDEATQVKDKLLGIQSKTGKDSQENIFMKKVVSIFKSYPFFFKPIQDGTTNPRMELAFREPSKRITKKNKTSTKGDALNTIINWKNTTNNAYDGEKLHMLYLDEAGKWEKPVDIT